MNSEKYLPPQLLYKGMTKGVIQLLLFHVDGMFGTPVITGPIRTQSKDTWIQ